MVWAWPGRGKSKARGRVGQPAEGVISYLAADNKWDKIMITEIGNKYVEL
jgi:hypothetical protein